VNARLETLGIEVPIVQAGMGGGLAGADLAAAVSEAGGLGTIGFTAADYLAAEVRRARHCTARPIAVNLLLPFARPAHWRAADEADVVVTFWGKPLRRTDRVWIHQAGSPDEAKLAKAAGADAVIAQGVEAGGHVRGTLPAVELLGRVRAAVGRDYPVLSAGGLADRGDVAARLGAGAYAAVLGTRFLMSEESGAHAGYRARVAEATETILTELFGVGWPAAHRVIANEATRRWLADDPRGPGWVRGLHRLTAPLVSRIPVPLQMRLAGSQVAARPFFGPAAPTAGVPEAFLDAAPLYAGETVAKIADVRPAGELVRELVPR
jgi:NAD(P)H-dependent flavin oxidoreductase YrpB (nitropropane dioxygenase family)